MKIFIGFLAGIATAYAALSIWRTLPGLPEDPAFEPQADANTVAWLNDEPDTQGFIR